MNSTSPAYSLTRKEEITLIVILFIIQFSHMLDFVIMMPLGPQLMRVFTISPQQFGFLVSAYTFSASIFSFANAFFIDKFDRKSALLVACAGLGVSTLLCALAPSYLLLLLARITAGAFGGSITALTFSIIGDVIPAHRRGAAMGSVMAAFSVASVIGIPLGIYSANHAGWHMPFFSLAVIILMTLIAGYFVLQPMNAHKTVSADNLLQSFVKIATDFNHLNAFAFTITLMLAGFSVIPYIAAFMVSNVGLTEHDLPYIYFFGGLFTFFSLQLIGRLADRYEKKWVFSLIALSSIVPVLLLTHLSKVPLAWALTITTLFMVLVSGRFVPAMAMITASVELRYRGRFMSLNSALQQMACGMAVLIAGSIMSVGSNGVLIGYDKVGIFSVTATLLAIFLGSKLQARS